MDEGLREELFFQLLRMYRMKAFTQLAEFLQGETAVMIDLAEVPDGVNPSVLSEKLHMSRARVAQILTGLSAKKWVTMTLSPDDRRKTVVRPTAFGIEAITEKRGAVERYFDRLIEKLGNQKTADLSVLIKEIVDKMEETEI